MVTRKFREVELEADVKKTNSLYINEISIYDKSNYFVEDHNRQEKAKCYFCKTTVQSNPDFKKRSKLICTIGDKMNLNQEVGFIVSDDIIYYYQTEWLDGEHYFEVSVDYVFSDKKIKVISRK